MSDNDLNDFNDNDDDVPNKKTRGVATGNTVKQGNPSDLGIEFNEYGQPIGKYHAKFVSDTGVLVKNNIKITYNDWRKVPQGEKETLWKDIKITWKINDDTNKDDVLKLMCKAFREFRSTLTRTYITRTMKLKDGKLAAEDDTPVRKYDQIKPDVWEEFKKQRMEKSFLEKSAKAQASQRHNKHPHFLGRSGYASKKEEWFKEELMRELKEKNLDNDDADPLLVKEVVIAVTKRIKDRGFLWIRAHTPSSNAPLPQTQNVIEEYKNLKEKEKTGEFVPTRLEDALTKALGKSEHNGRTRGVGGSVGLQRFFGKPPSRKSSGLIYSEDEVQRLVENAQREANEKFRRETMAEMEMMMEKKWAELLEKTSTGASFKDASVHWRDHSSSHSTHQISTHEIDPFVQLKESVFCRLAVRVKEELITVAEGMVFPWVEGKKVHNKPLTMENAHVCIDEVLRGDLPLPLPWTGFTMVGDAEGSFAQWPKSLILLRENEVTSKTGKPKRKNTSKNTQESASKLRKQSVEKEMVKDNTKASSCGGDQDDFTPLSAEEILELGHFCRSLEDKLCSLSKNDTIEMVIDDSVYNYKESTRSFLTVVEIRQMLRNKWLNVVMLQIWGSFLYQLATKSGATELVGYMCPVKLCEYMHRGRDCEDYLVHVWKIQDDKNYIIGAFHERNHWMLIVTCLGLNTIYILDSDKKNPKRFDIKKRLQGAWSIHCMYGGRRNFAIKGNKLNIIDDILCPQQPEDYECGYYVMQWMYNITFHFSSKKEEEFVKLMEESRMSRSDIYEIKEEWASKCLENM